MLRQVDAQLGGGWGMIGIEHGKSEFCSTTSPMTDFIKEAFVPIM